MRPFTGEPKQSQRGDIYFTILESNLEQCQSQTFLLDAPIYAHTHLPVPLNLSFAALPTCPGICIGVLRVLFYTVLFHGKEILTRSVKGLKKGCSRWLHTYRYKWIPGSLPSSCQKKGVLHDRQSNRMIRWAIVARRGEGSKIKDAKLIVQHQDNWTRIQCYKWVDDIYIYIYRNIC